MFEEQLRMNWQYIKNIYDLVAFCYDFLRTNIEDEGNFLATYIFENEQAKEKNKNLDKFHRFVNKMKKIFEDGATSYDINYIKNKIEKQIQMTKKQLVGKGENEEEQLMLAFFILKAIDKYIYDNITINIEKAPLNNHYNKNCFVYLNICKSMIDEAAKELDFSDAICAVTIRNQLSHLNIVEKNDIPNAESMEAPKLVPLYIADNDKKRKTILQEKKIKIAVIPFGQNEMLKFPVVRGALFRVEYTEWHKANGKAWALNFLDKALEKKANIIIFPEFVCSEEIQIAIGERLNELYINDSNKISELFLVIAGSGWTQDNNNVARIYAYNGICLGKQYKYASFADLKSPKNSWCEDLLNPGKETTIIEIPDMGRCLTGICRDISNRSYIKRLAEIFFPQFLLVPAWSPSINNGFKLQFEEIIGYNHKTSSVLCNCCEALISKTFREDYGLCVTPYKEETTIVGGIEKFTRSEVKCLKNCKNGGCLYMITLDYKTEMVKKKKIVKNCNTFFM